MVMGETEALHQLEVLSLKRTLSADDINHYKRLLDQSNVLLPEGQSSVFWTRAIEFGQAEIIPLFLGRITNVHDHKKMLDLAIEHHQNDIVVMISSHIARDLDTALTALSLATQKFIRLSESPACISDKVNSLYQNFRQRLRLAVDLSMQLHNTIIPRVLHFQNISERLQVESRVQDPVLDKLDQTIRVITSAISELKKQQSSSVFHLLNRGKPTQYTAQLTALADKLTQLGTRFSRGTSTIEQLETACSTQIDDVLGELAKNNKLTDLVNNMKPVCERHIQAMTRARKNAYRTLLELISASAPPLPEDSEPDQQIQDVADLQETWTREMDSHLPAGNTVAAFKQKLKSGDPVTENDPEKKPEGKTILPNRPGQ